jgi:hypothetical protein
MEARGTLAAAVTRTAVGRAVRSRAGAARHVGSSLWQWTGARSSRARARAGARTGRTVAWTAGAGTAGSEPWARGRIRCLLLIALHGAED